MYICVSFVLKTTPCSGYHFSCFADKNVEAQREEGPCPRPLTPVRLSEPASVLMGVGGGGVVVKAQDRSQREEVKKCAAGLVSSCQTAREILG